MEILNSLSPESVESKPNFAQLTMQRLNEAVQKLRAKMTKLNTKSLIKSCFPNAHDTEIEIANNRLATAPFPAKPPQHLLAVERPRTKYHSSISGGSVGENNYEVAIDEHGFPVLTATYPITDVRLTRHSPDQPLAGTVERQLKITFSPNLIPTVSGSAEIIWDEASTESLGKRRTRIDASAQTAKNKTKKALKNPHRGGLVGTTGQNT